MYGSNILLVSTMTLLYSMGKHAGWHSVCQREATTNIARLTLGSTNGKHVGANDHGFKTHSVPLTKWQVFTV